MRAYRTSRNIAHAGPASPGWFGLCLTCHHCLAPYWESTENRGLRRISKRKFSAPKRFLWTIIVHVGLPITRHAVSLGASGSGEAQAHPGGFFLASAQRTAIKSYMLDSMK